jgi:hypothetical protein
MSLASEYLESLHERYYSDDITDTYLSAKGYDLHEEDYEEDYEYEISIDEEYDDEEVSERAGDLIAEMCAVSEDAYVALQEEIDLLDEEGLHEAKKKGGGKRKGFKPSKPFRALNYQNPNKYKEMQKFKRKGLLKLGKGGIMKATADKLIQRADKIGFNAVIRALLNLHIMTRNDPDSPINKIVNKLYAKVKSHFDKARKTYDKLPLAQRKKKRRPGDPTKSGKEYLAKRRSAMTRAFWDKDTEQGKAKGKVKGKRATIGKGATADMGKVATELGKMKKAGGGGKQGASRFVQQMKKIKA